eukprot:scaffold3608_cov183-Amphora_coffeaeformis.AAC.2
MIRVRDVLAVLASIYLTRMAWDDPSESIAATAHLSFYVAREEADNKNKDGSSSSSMTRYLTPVLLDVDGDGAAEGLASPVFYAADKEWKLQILDLKPAAVHSQDKTHVAPFQPALLYESEAIVMEEFVMEDLQPISMTTGQVLLKHDSSQQDGPNKQLKDNKYNGIVLGDKNRKYFCGNDWHDASQKCSTPCPGGQASECPSGERCFADTPCDIAQVLEKDTQSSRNKQDTIISIDDLYVTPAGGLPSIFTLWSSGTVTMHSLTANATESRGSKRRPPASKLKVKPMWSTHVMKGGKRPYAWSDLHVTYLDAIDAGNLDGMLLVQAAVDFFPPQRDNATVEDHPDDLETMLFLTALDGRTGKIIWEADVLKSYSDQERDAPLPVEPGTSSSARRRSGIPFNMDENGSGLATNCLHNYRRSLLTSGALPYLYWGDEDAVVHALHFETQPQTKPHAKAKNGHKHNHHQQPHRGKPNVVVSKTHRGIQVRSLRNGRSLCHVSLWHETLYADLNHDGVLDATFMMTGKHRLPGEDETADMSEDEKWIYKLMLRVVEDEEARVQSRRDQRYHHVCHSMTLSGIPPREELFTYPMCELDHEHNEELLETEPGPPLAVEAMRGKGHDLILAVNNGILHRVRSNGRKQWELYGRYHENFPTWEDGSYTLIDRIDAKKVIPSTRPVVVTGDNSMALVAPRSGVLLSTAAFPQPVTQRPVLVDFNGDGTTDLIVTTGDAFWGYHVSVRTGSSVFFRIAVGLLLMGVMLALLRNRFGPKPGKRSTDA